MQIRPAAPHWSLIAHIDASSPDLEPDETREVDVMEASPRQGVDVTVQLRRVVVSPEEHRGDSLRHGTLAGLAGVTALGAAAASVCALPLLVGLPLAGLALGVGWALGKNQAQDALMSWAMATTPPVHQEPAWQGTRTFRLGEDREPGRIDAPVVHQSPDTDTPSPRALGEFFGREMKRFPSSRHAVMLSGHGMAWNNVIGLGLDEVGEALDHAKNVAGKRPDLLILESCLMGNLEALNLLGGTAGYAVVSEETMGSEGLPWERILGAASGMARTPQALGKAMVRLSPDGAGQVETLGLVDLDRVPRVASAVEELAGILKDLAPSQRRELRAAFAAAESLPRGGAPGVPDGFLVDLGSLLENLEERLPQPEVHQAADRVRAELKKALVAHGTSADYEYVATGLTIQGNARGLDTREYAEATGMTGWAGLLHELKPWPGRWFTHAPS